MRGLFALSLIVAVLGDCDILWEDNFDSYLMGADSLQFAQGDKWQEWGTGAGAAHEIVEDPVSKKDGKVLKAGQIDIITDFGGIRDLLNDGSSGVLHVMFDMLVQPGKSYYFNVGTTGDPNDWGWLAQFYINSKNDGAVREGDGGSLGPALLSKWVTWRITLKFTPAGKVMNTYYGDKSVGAQILDFGGLDIFCDDDIGDCESFWDNVQLARCSEPPATCFDFVKNGDEVGIDCQGPCQPCSCFGATECGTSGKYECKNFSCAEKKAGKKKKKKAAKSKTKEGKKTKKKADKKPKKKADKPKKKADKKPKKKADKKTKKTKTPAKKKAAKKKG